MKLLFALLALALSLSASAAPKKDVAPYKNKNLSTAERVEDLLSRMTLEEKVGQTLCLLGWDGYVINGNENARRNKGAAKVSVSDKFKKELTEQYVGMYWGTYRADPWTRKTLANGLTPELAAKAGNAIQRYALENTRLGIPVFLAEEAPHGHMAIGTTVLPTGIGMAATFDTELMERAGELIGKVVRLQGGHISYGPILDIARDPRWSRVEETLGEDPVLTGEMGAAMVRGLGGGDLSQPYSTIATLKHFLAYGANETFLPPFRKVVDAGALSVMTSYNSMDGIPCTANRYLLTDVLKKQWKFRGFVVSDLYSIDGIWETHHVAPTLQDAGVIAARAGVEVDLGGKAFYELIDAVRQGKIEESVVDDAVRQVLRLKFDMGLFDNPYVDTTVARTEVHNDAAIALARRAACESITLLKNDNNVLPLAKNVRVAVVGPNADNRYNQLGDYTAPQPDGKIKTVLDGVKEKLPDAQVEYVRGCAVRDTTETDIDKAVEAARRADRVLATSRQNTRRQVLP